MKTIVDITLGYPMSAPFATDPYDLLSLMRRHPEPVRIYFHIRCVIWMVWSSGRVLCAHVSAEIETKPQSVTHQPMHLPTPINPNPPRNARRKFDVEDVDWEDDAAVSAWLTQRFVEKDRLLDAFYAGKGPLLEDAREEGSAWRDILIDLVLWSAVQYGFYLGLWRAGGWGLAQLRGLLLDK